MKTAIFFISMLIILTTRTYSANYCPFEINYFWKYQVHLSNDLGDFIVTYKVDRDSIIDNGRAYYLNAGALAGYIYVKGNDVYDRTAPNERKVAQLHYVGGEKWSINGYDFWVDTNTYSYTIGNNTFTNCRKVVNLTEGRITCYAPDVGKIYELERDSSSFMIVDYFTGNSNVISLNTYKAPHPHNNVNGYFNLLGAKINNRHVSHQMSQNLIIQSTTSGSDKRYCNRISFFMER